MHQIKELFFQLKLTAFLEGLDPLLEKYPQNRETILETMKTLCEAELSTRRQKSVAYRIDQARFVQIKTVETFDFEHNPSTLKLKGRYLKLLEADFLSQGLSALFVGSSGLGKTHLAKALGYRLCQKNVRVRFTNLSAMGLELTTADSTGRLKSVMLQYSQPALLILDEIGYVGRLRELESNLVFQIISERYDGARSTVITTNKPFGEWNQIFHNDAMAHAIIDRLAERSEVFHLEGKSYRETHRKRLAE